jgi:hypothetical protein
VIANLLIVSLVVMCLAHTVTKERIGEPIRRRCGPPDRWLGYLMSCPYCLSHWLAFALVPLTGVYAVPVSVEWGPLTAILKWFLSSILVAAIAAFMRVGFFFIDEGQALVRRRKEITEHFDRRPNPQA